MKIALMAALVLCSASMVFADNLDPRVSPGQGNFPDPSPCVIGADGGTCIFTGNVLEVTFSTANNVTCGISNAFLDNPGSNGVPSAAIYSAIASGGIFNIQNYEFASTGGECIYKAFSGPPGSDGAEDNPQPCVLAAGLCTKAANDCTLTNLTAGFAGAPPPAGLLYYNDPDDCTGIGPEQGGALSFTVTGANGNFTITPNVVTTPEPASLALLGVGFAGLFMLRRRRLA